MTGAIVDVGALWTTIWTAALAGILITVCCSFAVLGAARASEHRATGRAHGQWLVLSATGTLAMAVVVLFGLSLIVD